jgi:hypothetical protein
METTSQERSFFVHFHFHFALVDLVLESASFSFRLAALRAAKSASVGDFWTDFFMLELLSTYKLLPKLISVKTLTNTT